MTQKIVLYDTTLRDGTQAEDVNLSTPRLEQRLEVFHTVHMALSGPRNVSFCVYIMDM